MNTAMNGLAMHASIRIALADDHAVVRTGYRRLLELEPGIEVAAEFANGETAYQWLQQDRADVLVLDMSMPGRGGLETLRRIRARKINVAVLIFSMHDSPDIVGQALEAGANGYVTKSSPPEVLVDAVQRLAKGETVLSDDVAHACREAEQAPMPDMELSPREFEIFRLLAQGEDVPEIARRLCLSEKTVFNYQTTIRQKTGLNSTLDMHRYASRRRLIAA